MRYDRRAVTRNDLENGWLIGQVRVAAMEVLALSAEGIDAGMQA